MLICFALSVFLLGASSSVDDNLARARDDGPQAAGKYSSSGLASKHPTGMTHAAGISTKPVASSVMGHEE